MVTASTSPLKSGKDCNGKIMGVGALNDLTALGTMAWVDQTGGDWRSLHYVEIPGSAIAAAVEAGRIDAGTMPNPQFGRRWERPGTPARIPYSAIARRVSCRPASSRTPTISRRTARSSMPFGAFSMKRRVRERPPRADGAAHLASLPASSPRPSSRSRSSSSRPRSTSGSFNRWSMQRSNSIRSARLHSER